MFPRDGRITKGTAWREIGTPGSLSAISPVLTSALGGASVGYVSVRSRRTWLMRAEPELHSLVSAFGLQSGPSRGGLKAANWVCRSRRPRRMRACGADATRIHHAGMKRPAVGAAFAERWSERSSGVMHGSVCRQLQDYVLVRRASRFSGETFKAVSDGVRADWA
jgi:hypothetical protein